MKITVSIFMALVLVTSRKLASSEEIPDQIAEESELKKEISVSPKVYSVLPPSNQRDKYHDNIPPKTQGILTKKQINKPFKSKHVITTRRPNYHAFPTPTKKQMPIFYPPHFNMKQPRPIAPNKGMVYTTYASRKRAAIYPTPTLPYNLKMKSPLFEYSQANKDSVAHFPPLKQKFPCYPSIGQPSNSFHNKNKAISSVNSHLNGYFSSSSIQLHHAISPSPKTHQSTICDPPIVQSNYPLSIQQTNVIRPPIKLPSSFYPPFNKTKFTAPPKKVHPTLYPPPTSTQKTSFPSKTNTFLFPPKQTHETNLTTFNSSLNGTQTSSPSTSKTQFRASLLMSDKNGWIPITPNFTTAPKIPEARSTTSSTVQNFKSNSTVASTLELTREKPKTQSVNALDSKNVSHNSTNRSRRPKRHLDKFKPKKYDSSLFPKDKKNYSGKKPDIKIKHHHHHHHHKYIEKFIEMVKVPYKVYVDKPYPVEKKVPYPVEKIVHKVIEKKVPYPVTKVVHKVVEKKVPYPVKVKVPQLFPITVPHYFPYKVVEKEYIVKPVPIVKHIINNVEKKVPYPVGIIVPANGNTQLPHVFEPVHSFESTNQNKIENINQNNNNDWQNTEAKFKSKLQHNQQDNRNEWAKQDENNDSKLKWPIVVPSHDFIENPVSESFAYHPVSEPIKIPALKPIPVPVNSPISTTISSVSVIHPYKKYTSVHKPFTKANKKKLYDSSSINYTKRISDDPIPVLVSFSNKPQRFTKPLSTTLRP